MDAKPTAVECGVPVTGQVAPWPGGLGDDYAAISLGGGFNAPSLVLWLGGGGFSLLRDQSAQSVWVELTLGARAWVRFDRRIVVMGRAAFEATQVLPVHGQERPPQGASWFPEEPLSLRS